MLRIIYQAIRHELGLKVLSIFAATGLTLLFGAIGYFVSSAMKK